MVAAQPRILDHTHDPREAAEQTRKRNKLGRQILDPEPGVEGVEPGCQNGVRLGLRQADDPAGKDRLLVHPPQMPGWSLGRALDKLRHIPAMMSPIFPATCYQLPANSYQLPATCYQLPATSYQLPATVLLGTKPSLLLSRHYLYV